MPTTKKPGKRKPPVMKASTRAADDALREELRHVDLRKLDKALAKAIHAPASRR